jgi:hypothetical protein
VCGWRVCASGVARTRGPQPPALGLIHRPLEVAAAVVVAARACHGGESIDGLVGDAFELEEEVRQLLLVRHVGGVPAETDEEEHEPSRCVKEEEEEEE